MQDQNENFKAKAGGYFRNLVPSSHPSASGYCVGNEMLRVPEGGGRRFAVLYLLLRYTAALTVLF